ncbi:flagellar protein FlgN [Desertibacillus haloalkaliphilus]|uniref:flagellar protein FlgN n=1 Tax=Desertibacillus haloalkaliphilus TaxID=1328930 RepID=UPI001C27198B|nr:flagellar protein FlgN [Desertibacillus haloalkaliphilus]MBU8905986.1 flagellar protein FlgN [Desertibacillus haloalkaliphilus]
MSTTKAIIDVIAKLVKAHQSLNELAKQKTEVLKKGDMPALDKISQQEMAHVQQLQKLEQDRLDFVDRYVKQKGLMTEGVTMDILLEHVPVNERVILKKLQDVLVAEVDTLKQQNELNQQLIEDSLRFVNLSLDLVMPEPDEVNYQRPTTSEPEPQYGRSLFDSKA